MTTIKREVTLGWGAVVTGINAAQLAALDVPRGVHVGIFITTSVLGYLGLRSNVTPVWSPSTSAAPQTESYYPPGAVHVQATTTAAVPATVTTTPPAPAPTSTT